MTYRSSFFVGNNAHFFSPLNGKFREQAYQCICELYDQVNGPECDFRSTLSRRDVLDTFDHVIRHTPLLDSEDTPVGEELDSRDLASQLLRKLIDCGWLETYRDPSHMRTSYRFTWLGRRFATVFTQDQDDIQIDTQNSRSTLVHLRSFVDRYQSEQVIDTDALMMAVRFSRGVVNDFTEAIEHTVSRRVLLIATINEDLKEARARGQQTLEYMAGPFMQELSDRFLRDNIDLFNREIIDLLTTIMMWPTDVKIDIEKRLRKRHPKLLDKLTQQRPHPFLLGWANEQIERYVEQASQVLMPELRREVRSLVHRAKMHFDYLNRLNYQSDSPDSILNVIRRLEALTVEAKHSVLEHAVTFGTGFDIRLMNIDQVTPPKSITRKDEVNTVEVIPELTDDEKRRLLIARAINESFQANSLEVRDYIINALHETRFVQMHELPVTSTKELICALNALSHAGISAINPVSGQPLFRITPRAERMNNEYFDAPNYEIEYLGE
ncbi:MAG: hypothetical protein HWE39_09960 [Oceanospirillaceae bacterium]|nr:hypothetical protein [Oceanospirillaceae bacterium]